MKRLLATNQFIPTIYLPERDKFRCRASVVNGICLASRHRKGRFFFREKGMKSLINTPCVFGVGSGTCGRSIMSGFKGILEKITQVCYRKFDSAPASCDDVFLLLAHATSYGTWNLPT